MAKKEEKGEFNAKSSLIAGLIALLIIAAIVVFATHQSNTTDAKAVACSEQYDPVCGENAQTYINACQANMAGVSIAHIGICKAPITIEGYIIVITDTDVKAGFDTLPLGQLVTLRIENTGHNNVLVTSQDLGLQIPMTGDSSTYVQIAGRRVGTATINIPGRTPISIMVK